MNVTATNQTSPASGVVAARKPAAPAEASGKTLPRPGQSTPAGRPQPAVPKINIDKAIAQIQAFLSDSKRQLTFERDEASGRMIVRVIDPESGEVVRQFPPEELLKIAAIVDAQGFHTFDEQV